MSAETFGDLMAALRAFRDEYLPNDPSNRAIARALKVSPQTVGDWLKGAHFPDQDAEAAVTMVRMVAASAGGKGVAAPDGLLDPDRWREAHRAEAARRRTQNSDAAIRARAQRAAPPGIPLAEATDPFQFEVHHPVEAEGDHPGLPPLPPYVPRPHDERLASVVQAAAEGRSGIAVLVGGSSTGKTRACWETLTTLDIPNGSWRLWHPLFPSPASAALDDLPLIAPRTILWLNEAQRYLDSSDGEKLAAGLRELLRDSSRGPVLILATLWPEHWRTLTERPSGESDPHAQARELLSGHDIIVPQAFSEADLRALAEASDPRLLQAARTASGDGKITQFIAGAPELLTRYHTAEPVTKALITAAMDARRLGMGESIPLDFLEAAVPAYLDDENLDVIDREDDWLERALTDAVKRAKGIPGPLTRIRRTKGEAESSESSYRLADYLDQHGRLERQAEIPGKEFWAACEILTDPVELRKLGRGAKARGLLFRAARLFKRGVMYGDAESAQTLVRCLKTVFPDERNPQWHVAEYVGLDDTWAVALLISVLREVGAEDVLAALVARDPGAHVALDDVSGAIALMEGLWYAGATEQADEVAANAADNVVFDDALVLARLVDVLAFMGSKRSLDVLLGRDLAARVSLDDRRAVDALVRSLHSAGAQEEACALTARSMAHFGQEFQAEEIILKRSRQGRDVYVAEGGMSVHVRNLDLLPLHAVAEVLRAVEKTQAALHEIAVADWMTAAGQFSTHFDQGDNDERYRFGREPDGTPAEPWGWDDLITP